MSSNTQPYRKIGLLNCCIQTIRLNPLPPAEGETMVCLICRAKLRYTDHAWEFGDITPRERTNATTIRD